MTNGAQSLVPTSTPTPATERDYTAIALAYEEGVLSGAILACRKIRKAVERSRRYRAEEAAQGDQSRFRYSRKAAHRVCRFAELFRHIEGDLAGELLVLEGWQVWNLVNIFGWLYRSTGKRKHRTVHLEVPRGNGKSFLLSILCIYMLAADGEPGAQIYTCATKKDQARIVYDATAILCRDPRNSALMKKLGVEVFAHRIIVRKSNSKMLALPKDTKSADGLNVHLACMDEIHAYKNRATWDVIGSGTAKRSNSMIVSITTAGDDVSSLGYERNQYVSDVMEGVFEDESLWGAIYTIDGEDDWTAERTWEKANPGWHGAVNQTMFRSRATNAVAVAGARPEFFAKQLNVWGVKTKGYGSLEDWRRAGFKDVDPDAFLGKKAYVGVDLSFVDDICATSIVFPENRDGEVHYTVINIFYLPERAVQESKNAQYKGWEMAGHLIAHKNPTVQHTDVADHIIELCKLYDVQGIGIDQYGSKPLIQRLENEGLKPMLISQGTRSMNSPTKYLDELARNNRLHYGDDPIFLWMLNNVELKTDDGGNVKPDRKHSRDKIDGVYSVLDAMQLALAEPPEFRSIYSPGGALSSVSAPQK